MKILEEDAKLRREEVSKIFASKNVCLQYIAVQLKNSAIQYIFASSIPSS